NKYPAAYNAPAGVCLRNAWDIDVTGSFIYWHVSQEGMDLVHVPPVSTTDPLTSNNGSVASQNFNYKPGFKVGLGFNLDHDGWRFCAEYTWLHQTSSGSATPPTLPTLAPGTWTGSDWFPVAVLSTASAASMSSSWKVNFDMLDVLVSRPFYEGT